MRVYDKYIDLKFLRRLLQYASLLTVQHAFVASYSTELICQCFQLREGVAVNLNGEGTVSSRDELHVAPLSDRNET